MNENRLELTKEQFDKFLRLPVATKSYGYYTLTAKQVDEHKHLRDNYDNWFIYCGVEFVVPRG